MAPQVTVLLGLATSLMAAPVALGGNALIAAGAGIGVIRWAKMSENAADYSVMNTGRQMLWLPTKREEKYKAKQAIDTFFVRTGDLLAALVVFLGTHVMALGVPGFAWANIAVVLVAIGVAVMLVRENRRLAASPEFSRA